MKRALIIGRSNVGKTLFCIHFAEYLGLSKLRWRVQHPEGQRESLRLGVQQSKAALTNSAPHFTRALQSVDIAIPRGKLGYQLMLTDSTGLTDGIHSDVSLRRAMAQTLEELLHADVILHMVDAAEIVWAPLDEQIYAFGRKSSGYLLLANKIDLPAAKRGYRQLARRVSPALILPVSALNGNGFREVKQCVWRMV
ncbi:GTPase [Alicyclobacillus kakegawensis]|uniref:GTPase n=1 Tax=Alicyclobacillus kakegawensis TaxID=392012 RepID=UPI0008308B18|nr:GTPase [Alicyclobacillus kakegawensis]